MKKFISSSIQQLTQNVFAFVKEKEAILFNRINFDVDYLPLNSFPLFDKIAKNMEEKTPILKFRVPPLRKIRVEVNFKCNLACDYCLVLKNQLAQIDESMNLNTAKEIVDFYKRKIKHGSIMISGGEPFLNWPVVKFFVEKIKDSIKIFTNGTILNDDILSVFKKAPHVRVMVSLDGRKTDNKFRKLQNGKEVYSKVVKNIKTLKRNKIKVGIAALCLDHNVKHLSKIVKFFFKSLGINYMGFNFPHFTKEKILDVNMEEYTQQMINIFDFAVQNRIYIDQLTKRFTLLITKKFRFYACKLVGEQITFYPDGKTSYCSKIDTLNSSGKYDLNYFLSVIPINNSFCKNCPAIGTCGGGCFWDGLMRFKHGVDERECILNKKLLDYFLWKIHGVLKRKSSPLIIFQHFLQ
jgi:radical SAM protein with 4Fe4S-binding SPASM domain